MAQSRLSINVKPSYTEDWNSCKQFLTVLDPSVAVVGIDNHNDFHLIQEAQAAAPNTKIVARFIDKEHDGSMHLKPQTTRDKYIVSPFNQLDRIRKYGQNGFTAYFGNEPDTKASPDDLKRLADHTIEAMDLAASRDFDMSLTILNLGIGHPKPVDGMLPSWVNPVLLKLNEHRNRHYYGLHVYLPLDILEHLNALKKTCDYLKIPMPRCIITEWGYDADGSGSDGFKSRNIPPEIFADTCVSVITNQFRPFIESGDLLGVCTFIYGDDASWHNFNVETSTNRDEVSTAWRNRIQSAAIAGKLTVKPTEPPALPVAIKDVQRGEQYRLISRGKLIDVYAMPPTSPASTRIIATLPDNVAVEVYNKATINNAKWFQIKHSTFDGLGWINVDLIDIRQTVTVPTVVIPPEVPAVKPDEQPQGATGDLAIPIGKTAETPLETQKMGYIPTAAQITLLQQWRSDLAAYVETTNQRIELIDQLLALKA